MQPSIAPNQRTKQDVSLALKSMCNRSVHDERDESGYVIHSGDNPSTAESRIEQAIRAFKKPDPAFEVKSTSRNRLFSTAPSEFEQVYIPYADRVGQNKGFPRSTGLFHSPI